MAAGDSTDVLRSARRYVALVLGSPPWTVRIGRARVADDQRPAAAIDASGPLTTLWSRAGGFDQGDVRKARTLTVTAYPVLQSTEAESMLAADELAGLLEAGFERGLVTDDVPAQYIGAPWRVPIFDFAGVPITGAGRAGPATPYAYAEVSDTGFNVRPIQDPLDELRYTVVATVPLRWWRGGRRRPDAPTVQQIPGGGWQPGLQPPVVPTAPVVPRPLGGGLLP